MASDASATPALHRSVFAKLVVIMLVMGGCLLGMVGGFYFVIVLPGIHTSLHRLVGQHVRAIAASAPDFATATRLARTLEMEIRYEDGAEGWTTSPGVPTRVELARLADRRHFGHLFRSWRAYYVVPGPNGGVYIFERTLAESFRVAHSRMVVMLLLLMAAVFATAYVVLRRALRPLRWLNEGVARLGEGQLDVVVPNPTRDEFGILTEAFNRMAARVRAMVQARDQLLLDVSHELRSPLTRLRVALALLPEDARKAGMAADLAEMETMVLELLEMERLRERGGIRPVRTDLVPLLRAAAESFEGRPPGVRLVSPPAELSIELDAERIRVVLRNVLENAIKYSPPESRPVEISVARRGDEVVVRVADDGPGIPPEESESLFEPFFRLDRSRSKKTGGYGLGLSICKRIMQAHGGSIAVEPHGGRGAVFLLRFPAVSNAAPDEGVRAR